MISSNGPSTTTTTFDAKPALTRWDIIANFFVRYRVRITAFVLIALIVEDILEEHLAPRSPFDVYSFYSMLGLGLVLAGLLLRSWAAGTLHKNSELTTCGPYGFLRHPLYAGSFLAMLGICTLINDRGENFWVVCGPLLAIIVLRAIKEERHLAEKFPTQWADYGRRVGRFFPRSLPRNLFTQWRLKQWLDNREYRFASAILLGLVGLQVWRILE